MSRFNKPITGKTDEHGRMQVEVFPQRVLNVETAQKLIDELNEIEGISRIVVYGPRLPKENPDDLLKGKYGAVEKKYLNIKGEQIELTTQVGRVWIEVEGAEQIEQIRKAAEKALPFPFEMYEGLYIRKQKTITDYARRGGKVDKIRKAAEKVLPFPFEMYEGLYIRKQKTITDYARRGGKVDKINLGLFDPKDRRTPICCGDKPYDDHHEQA